VDILLPMSGRIGNPLRYLSVEMRNGGPGIEDATSASYFLSELLNDTSRAEEFLVTETHFTNLAAHCAKLAFGVMPCVLSPETFVLYIMVVLKSQFSTPELSVRRVGDNFKVGTMECLCLSLPRSSKSPELVQLLQDHAFQPSCPGDSGELREKREETAMACLKYIEVSRHILHLFLCE
jgi:hypothetical protein